VGQNQQLPILGNFVWIETRVELSLFEQLYFDLEADNLVVDFWVFQKYFVINRIQILKKDRQIDPTAIASKLFI
jgi:hypothetical protein